MNDPLHSTTTADTLMLDNNPENRLLPTNHLAQAGKKKFRPFFVVMLVAFAILSACSREKPEPVVEQISTEEAEKQESAEAISETNAVRALDMEQTNAILDRLSGTDPELLNTLRQLVMDKGKSGV